MIFLGFCRAASRALIACFVCASVARAQAQEAHDFSPLEKLLRDSLGHFDGGCGLILMQDGKILFEKTFGSHSLDSALPVASASKWLAGAVFMTLVEEGKLSLSDSARKYLPYFTDDKAGITLRHLLCHTSGLPGEVPAMRDRAITMKAAAMKIGAEKLLSKPGAMFLYGGASMQTAGRVMEIAAGQKPWEALFQERIAKPLGLTRTTFYGLGKSDNPLLAGGARSTPREYLRFLQMIFNKGVWNGKRILSEASVTEMHRDHTGGAPVMTYDGKTLAPQAPAEKANYGVGVWRVGNAQTGELIELNSQGRYGFSPWIDVKRGFIGVFSAKTPLKGMLPTYKRMKQLLREIITVPKPASPVTADKAGK